jgi:hypothetical protein
MTIPPDFKKATPDYAREKITKFETDNRHIESALTQLTNTFRKNESLPHVLLKVAAINSLYSTQIYAVYKTAERIVACNIDHDLDCGSTEVVDKIAWVQLVSADGDAKQRRNYSFATKYCSWHNQDRYPMYDTRVDKCLRAYQQLEQFTENEFTQDDLCNYQTLREVVDAFRRKYLDGFSYKQTDMFLFQLGNDYFYSAPPTSSATPPPQPAR